MPVTPKAPPLLPDDVEASFYEALQTADLDRLLALWADDEEVACVHPGGPRLVGLPALRAGFAALFGQGPVDVHPEQVRRLQTETMAIHHVLERVRVMGEQGPQTVYTLASNVFLKTPQGWRMVLHHASPGQPRAAQDLVEMPALLH